MLKVSLCCGSRYDKIDDSRIKCRECGKFCSLVTEKEYQDYWLEGPEEVSFDNLFVADNEYGLDITKNRNYPKGILESMESLDKEIAAYVYANIVDGGECPTCWHKDLEFAKKEAKRLAKLEGKKCSVIKRLFEYEPTTTLKETKF